MVFPFISYFDGTITFKPDITEVAEIINVSTTDLFDPKTKTNHEILIHSGERISAPSFVLQKHIVWGATAMILNEFIALMQNDSLKSN